MHISHLLSQSLNLIPLTISFRNELDLVLGLATGYGQAIEEAVIRYHVPGGPLQIHDARALIIFAENLVLRVYGANDENLPRDGGRVLSDKLSGAAE